MSEIKGQSLMHRGVAYVPQRTRSGDTLSTLSRAYGVSAQEIVEANGVPWNSTPERVAVRADELLIRRGRYTPSQLKKIVREADINEWVFGLSGQCLPGPAGGRAHPEAPLPPCTGAGWAVFNDRSELFLPARARADGKKAPPATKPVLVVEQPPTVTAPQMVKKPSTPGWVWLAGAGGVLLVVAMRKRKKRRAS